MKKNTVLKNSKMMIVFVQIVLIKEWMILHMIMMTLTKGIIKTILNIHLRMMMKMKKPMMKLMMKLNLILPARNLIHNVKTIKTKKTTAGRWLIKPNRIPMKNKNHQELSKNKWIKHNGINHNQINNTNQVVDLLQAMAKIHSRMKSLQSSRK